jgi:hypothetical protein
MRQKAWLGSIVVQAGLLVGCSGSDVSSSPGTSGGNAGSAAGGAATTGGAVGNGGTASGVGGSISSGGAIASGGTSNSATIATGGVVATGGAATGGVVNTGGALLTGGSINAGGTKSTGGASAAGGTKTTGGTSAAGGTVATGGAATTGGTKTNGGTSSAGGSSATGGATGTGGATTSCATVTPTACTSAPTVRITEIDVGATVVANEDDAALKLLSISPIPSGGSRVAWMGNDSRVHITTLDCNDNVVSTFGLPAMDYGDIYADNNGGVLLVARDAQGGGTLNCGNPANLCGTPPSPAVPCYDQYMVRFDGTTETWATKLTTSSATLPPYSTSPTSSTWIYYIWWYAHHGRLAFDGTNYAGYYGAAVSVSEACTTGGNTAINIHQGDEMRVVSPTGALLTGHNSFDWGCSHSGFEKIVWDPAANRFAMICRSDAYPQVGLNVNAANLVFAIDAANSAVSNLVLASGGGYWVLVSNVGALHMFKFTTGAATANLSLGTGNKPHLVTYGSHILGSWVPSGTNMVGQIFDAATGATVGSTFPIAVPSNQFHDFRNYSDGSAAYVAPGSTNTKLKIVRVMPCQ